ncbi:dimethylargininase [Longispora albida]|uniref:dimethylargininase n=1 Tax=Longispora albida TaxID=203523 RepID=UPI0003733E13|nr:dimethylargininase [Longispora albida]
MKLQPRHYLMCRPTYFTVEYVINPWMDPSVPVDNAATITQWEKLVETYQSLGHTVEFIDPLPGMPDMVFAANGATVIDGKVLGAQFRNVQRADEGPAYSAWFEDKGYPVQAPKHVNEGEGDFLVTENYVLAGTGFRTDPGGHAEAQEWFGRPVISLQLIDPRYYHLDTALFVLEGDQICYYPGAFSPGSQAVLARLFPEALLATAADAEAFGLNSVSDGLNVIVPPQATHLIGALKERGYNPIEVDLPELLKGGGGPKCCTLEIRK